MSDYIFLGNKATNVDVSPSFDTYSKVIIHISDEQSIEVGNNTGRTLEITNPFGTRQMAQDILQKLNGYQYQPYQADGALLTPAAEIGDTVSASTAYGMVFTREKQFSRLMKSDISAPCDEEINHEYTFESPQERKFTREIVDVRASIVLTNEKIESEVSRLQKENDDLVSEFSSQLSQTATQIEAQVSAVTNSKLNHTNTSQSFGWQLTASAFLLKNNNQAVFQFDQNGLKFISNGQNVLTVTRTGGLYVKGDGEFTGKITASSGSIGGFTINANDLRYNNMPWGGTQTNGIYIGISGIQLGQNFRVDNGGNVRLRGTLTFLNADGSSAGTLSAADLKQGAERANNGYSDWNSAYASTSYGGYCYGGAGYGYSYNDMTNNRTTATYLHGKYIYADNNVNTPILIVDGYSASWQTDDFYDRDGNHIYLRYLGR